jgi:hypothetical protein
MELVSGSREDTSMSNTSQRSMPQKQIGNIQNMSRTRISPFSWVMIILLLALGAINFAEDARESYSPQGIAFSHVFEYYYS